MEKELKKDLIDIVNACPNCSFGDGAFKKWDNKLIHFDLFYSQEASATFTCHAEHIINKYIVKYDKNQNPIFEKEFEDAYKKISDFYIDETDVLDDAVEKYVEKMGDDETVTKDELESHLDNVMEWAFKRGISYRIRILNAIEKDFGKEE